MGGEAEENDGMWKVVEDGKDERNGTIFGKRTEKEKVWSEAVTGLLRCQLGMQRQKRPRMRLLSRMRRRQIPSIYDVVSHPSII